MDVEEIKKIRCPFCKRKHVEIQRKDNPLSTTKICVNKDCSLYIDLSKVDTWELKIIKNEITN
jgi:hypothetical protein